MKPILFAFILVISFTCSYAQQSIKGSVVNAQNGHAIAGSSVFIANTTIGTVCASDGSFELSFIPEGRHELVITCIGYYTHSVAISAHQLPSPLRIQLRAKTNELENVTIEPFTEESWESCGWRFIQAFIGTSENARDCDILNKEAIRFRFYKNSRRLVALASEPIDIENNALGYNIKYQLENFEINFKQNTTAFWGYPLFEDLNTKGKKPKKQWEQNRQKAYNGSAVHFMRSLYHNQLQQEGFEVRRMTRSLNEEKMRVRNLLHPGSTKAPILVEMMKNKTTHLQALPFGVDSIIAHNIIMNQPDSIETLGGNLLTADSLIIGADKGAKQLSFDNYIYIFYKREPAEAKYKSGVIPKPDKATLQESCAYLLNDKKLTIEARGYYYPPQNITFLYYWGWSQKLCNMLPQNFNPETKPVDSPNKK